jgi:transcriptional regulator with XRE-family HTH domain
MEKHVNTNRFTDRFRQEFGLVVRRCRHKLNLSQEDFAEMADIHRTYVSSIELGKVEIGIGVAYKIARALRLPLSKLIKQAESSL